MKILIVDDDPVSRGVLRQIIAAQSEHQVAVADDGAAAWALLDDPNRYFDVAFVDIDMPKMNGLMLLQHIRSSPLLASVEVVLCTGSNDRATIAKAIQMGARHYIVKPCTAEVVNAKLRQIRPATPTIAKHRIAGG